jgi:hypothetical protein
LDQLPIPTPRFQKTFMVPTLNDLTLINDIDDVRVLDGAEPVSN